MKLCYYAITILRECTCMADTNTDHLTDRELLDQHYKGDKAKEAAESKRTRSLTLTWADIEADVKVYPEHTQQARTEISDRLGYLPHGNTIMPHEAFIRTLIEQHKKGLISTADYERDINTHIRHIRNDDMNKFGWTDTMRYTWAEIENHNNYLPQFTAMVHAKFTSFFGELPSVYYLLPADRMLRRAWLELPDTMVEGFTPFDYKAFTITAYRKVLCEQGKDAADNSPLLGRGNRLA